MGLEETTSMSDWMWNGIPLQMTDEVAALFPFKTSYDEFPDCYCGAGNGLGEKIVPDYVYWYTRKLPGALNISIKLSPACWCHDKGWDKAPPTWDAFHAENSQFYANNKAIIDFYSVNFPKIIRNHALKYPKYYSQAVDTFGRVVFWKLKQQQGYKIPTSASWLLK